MEKLQKAKQLIDTEQYDEAIHILEDLNKLSFKDDNFRLLLLSYSLYKTKKFNLSISNAHKLLQKNKKSEFASQLKYLSYFELKEYDKALKEITEFLSCNKANLYKVTLEELLSDVKKGFIKEKEMINQIKKIAKQNNVNL